MATPHTSCRKGTTVLMTLKDGVKWVDKFKDKKGSYVILEKQGRVRISEIRAMSIYKGKNFNEKIHENACINK